MEAVFLRILNMSLSAAAVIAVVLLVRLALRRAPKKWSYLLWSVVGFRLCCPVSFRAAFSLFRLAPALPASSVSAAEAASSSLAYIPAPVMTVPAQTVTAAPVVPAATAAPALPETAAEAVNAAASTAAASPAQLWLTVGMLLWLAGIAAMLVCAAVRCVRLKRRLVGAVRTSDGVWETDRIRSPFLLGVLRPRLYLPLGLSGPARGFVLAHEQYHVTHRDCLVKLFAWLLLAVHWFNPLVWLAFRLMSRDMEMRCDEAVLGRGDGGAKPYSYALLRFASEKRFPAPGPLAFGESDVKRRIQNVLNWKKPRTWVTLAAIVVVLTVIAVCAANPKENAQDLSFLNYKNAVSLIAQNGTQGAVYYGVDGSVVTGEADDRGLAQFLEQANWKKRRAPGRDPDFAGSVKFILEDSYCIVIWQSPRAAKVVFNGEARWYRTGKQDWEAARLLVRSPDMSLSGGGSGGEASSGAVEAAPSAAVEAALAEDWAAWNAKSEAERSLSSKLPGHVYREFETWAEACAFAGMTPWNPLEDSAEPVKMNWAGADVILPGSDALKHAYVSAGGPAEGGVTALTLQAGYEVADARVVLTAAAVGTFPVPESTERYALSGGETAVCARDSNESFTAAELYVLRGGACDCTVRVIADSEAALSAALNRTLVILGGAEAAAWSGNAVLTVSSAYGAEVIVPVTLFRFSETSGEHGWIAADGEPIEVGLAGVSLPNIRLGDDGLTLECGENASLSGGLRVYGADFTDLLMRDATGADLAKLSPNLYYCVQTVAQTGRYIESEGRDEVTGWDCVFRLIVPNPMQPLGGAEALQAYQQSDPEGFTKQMEAWGAEVNVRGRRFASAVGEAGDWQDIPPAFAQAWLNGYLNASADNPFACADGTVHALGGWVNAVSLTGRPRRLVFSVDLALSPVDADAFAFARMGWATKDEQGLYHIQTEAVLSSDDGVTWTAEGLNSGGGSGWGYRSVLGGEDAAVNIAYALSGEDPYGVHLLRFLPNLDWSTLSAEQFNTAVERLRFAALPTEAVYLGETDQLMRDLYMLWGAKNADGAYAELFFDGPESLLAIQYRADPAAFEQALAEMETRTQETVRLAMARW